MQHDRTRHRSAKKRETADKKGELLLSVINNGTNGVFNTGISHNSSLVLQLPSRLLIMSLAIIDHGSFTSSDTMQSNVSCVLWFYSYDKQLLDYCKRGRNLTFLDSPCFAPTVSLIFYSVRNILSLASTFA